MTAADTSRAPATTATEGLGEQTHAVYLCGGDYRPGPREACPNVLHDWPLPSGYVDRPEVAMSRIRHGWANKRCPDCGLYGWVQGRPTPHNDTRVESAR